MNSEVPNFQEVVKDTDKGHDNVECQILSENDQKLLFESGERLVKLFLDDFSEKLPDAIIFPDTAARPLYYLLEPILRRIAQERAISLPKCYFFKTIRPNSFHDFDLYELDYYDYAADPQLLKTKIDEQKMIGLRMRASDILYDLKKRQGVIDSSVIVIIDDDATKEANTISYIRRAFNNDAIPAYVLLAESQEVKNLRCGKIIKHDSQFSGFDYRGRPKVRGVEKGGPSIYSKTIDNSTIEKKSLRDDMKIIGNRIAVFLN